MSDNHHSFSELRLMLKTLPSARKKNRQLARKRWTERTKPIDSLGKLERWVEHLAAWQNDGPHLTRPRVAVFAANHGIAERGVSAFPSTVTAQMVNNMRMGGAAINQIARLADADLRVYEMSLEKPTKDISIEPAMTEQQCYQAICYGMTAVSDDIDLICLGEMGIGNTSSASALAHGLYGGKAGEWTGSGTGISRQTLVRKIGIIDTAVRRSGQHQLTPLEKLSSLGGLELAAICGAIIAARIAGVAVILDGFVCCAAAAVLAEEQPQALDHCLIASLSREPGHQKLCDQLGVQPELDLDLALGEASGAALMIPLLRAAVSCWRDMADFASGVDSAII